MNINKSYIDEIYKKLKSLQIKEGQTDFLYNSLLTVILILVILVLYSVVESLFNVSSLGRTILMFVYLALVIGFFSVRALYPLIKKITKFDFNALAIKAGNYLPLIKDELADVLQLAKEKGNNNQSGLLIEKAFESVFNKVKDENFARFIDFKPLKKTVRYTLYVTVFMVILFAVFPQLRESTVRLINFNTEYIPPAKYLFIISPGNYTVTRGEDVEIKINIKGPELSKVSLYLKYVDQTEFQKTEIETKGNNEFIYKKRYKKRSNNCTRGSW